MGKSLLETNKEYFYLQNDHVPFGTRVRVYKQDNEETYFSAVGDKKLKFKVINDELYNFCSASFRNLLKINKAIKLQKTIDKCQNELNEINFN